MSNDADIINAALKQVVRLEQLTKHHQPAATSLTSPVTSGTT